MQAQERIEKCKAFLYYITLKFITVSGHDLVLHYGSMRLLSQNMLTLYFCTKSKKIKIFHLGSESASPGHPVEVGVAVLRHVVVEHNVNLKAEYF